MVKKSLIIIVSIIVLGIGYYLISPLFINIKIDESIPSSSTKDVRDNQPAPNEIEIKSAKVIGTTGHAASGFVRIVRDGSDSYIRYENFKTINGPDIYVYLAKDLDAKEYISLGRVKATEGNINYKIPEDINIEDYKYAMIWCKAFGVLFNYADISNL
jgi:hypothetical protein